MFKRKLSGSEYGLILVNLVPLYGVWFEGWNAGIVFLVYCLESVIIGIFNVLKMAAVTIFVRPRDLWQNQGNTSMQSGWLFIIFFILHYGLFIFVQTQLFFGVSGIMRSGTIFGQYRAIPILLGREGMLLLFIFILYYTFQTLFDFFLSGQYRNISMTRLMFQPYGRIIVQQLVVILGTMFLSFGAGKLFILIMISVKIYFAVFFPLDRIFQLAQKGEKDQPSK